MSEQTKEPSAEAAATLAALQRAVTNTLQRKQQLGQFAVVWRDGQPALLDEQAQDKAAFAEALQQAPAHDQTDRSNAASGVAEPKSPYHSKSSNWPKRPSRNADE